MKSLLFNINTKLNNILIFIILSLLFLNSFSLLLKQESPEFYNQKEAYPNQFEAPTNTTQLDYNEYNPPLLSHSLFENDPKRQLKKEEFAKYIRFSQYRMTRGEADQLFSFVDSNGNDLVSQEEWDLFAALYIMPYEACDRNHDYLLNPQEFADCYEKDPKTRNVIFRRVDYPKRHSHVMWAITTRSKDILNIFDYVFFRRALFAWNNCQSNSKFIAKNQFKCAVKTAFFQRIHFEVDYNGIYDSILEIIAPKGLIELDFINYLKGLFSTYIFAVYGSPMNTSYLNKDNFIKSIREDRLPTNFDEEEVNTIYKLINTNPMSTSDQMDYHTFAFFHNLHRLFNKYSMNRPHMLHRTEVHKLLDDDATPYKIVWALDQAVTSFNEAMYQEASLALKKTKPNENAFFSFKSKDLPDASEHSFSVWNDSTINSTYFTTQKNETNRNVFFDIFSNPRSKEYMSKESFYRAFQLANLFTWLVPNKFAVSVPFIVDNLISSMESTKPPVSFVQRENFPVYRVLPREISIDILVFLAIENYRTKFKSVLNAEVSITNESVARLVIMDFGMKMMPETVFDVAKKGYDNLRRRTYEINDLFKNCIIVQAVAAENERNKLMTKIYDMKLTGDNSRKFPGFPRRAEASPFV